MKGHTYIVESDRIGSPIKRTGQFHYIAIGVPFELD